MEKYLDNDSKNYGVSYVEVGEVYDIKGADNIKSTNVFGNNIIIPKTIKKGDKVLYFVSGTQLSEQYCYENSLYMDSSKNKDTQKKGYMGKTRLVRAIKLKGIISDGFVAPVDSLNYLGVDLLLKKGDTFTHIDGVEICKKYSVLGNEIVGNFTDIICEKQLNFHNDTPQFARSLEEFEADDKVIITRKMHGSSVLLSRVLTNKKLNFVQRFINKFVTKIESTEYGFVWSSGKPKNNTPKGCLNSQIQIKTPNIWTQIFERYGGALEKGITIYGEIVGVGVQGSGYTYGIEGVEMFVYRITYTNVDGVVFEMSWEQVKDYCNKKRLKHVQEYFSGTLKECVGDNKEEWLEKLGEKYLNKSYPDCKVDEGVCIKFVKDNRIYKLKSSNFILKENEEIEKGVEYES